MNWKLRKIMCENQIQVHKDHPTNSIVDGMPIETYWERQLEIAKSNIPSEPLITDEQEIPD